MSKSVYPAIYIEWCDAMTNDSSWINMNTAIDWAQNEDWVIKQIGFVLKETKEYILITSKVNPQRDGDIRVDGTIKIPKTWVRKRKSIDLSLGE